jgi:glycosyltransferase involved in cell wall biosynthesis
MKIAQVNPGILPIPPKGWGAIEKIIWEIHNNIKSLNYNSNIVYTDDIKKDQYDIIHVHVANLALLLAERNIPYIFHLHDHHVVYENKDSFIYQQNLEAINKSEITLVPAKYLIEYMNPNKCIYFSHGVNVSIFKPEINFERENLLMVGNNGKGGYGEHDRKGFTLGINLAIQNNLTITIAGPSNNKNYFNSIQVPQYDKINIEYDPSEERLIELYRSHKIFIHPSELEAGHPNLTLLEAASCGLPILGCMENETQFYGMYKTERNLSQLQQGLEVIYKNYKTYQQNILFTANQLSWENRTKELIKIYERVINKRIY